MGYASRYYINGNYVTAASTPENYDWKGVIYDNGLSTINGEKYIKDADHLYGEEQTYVKDADGVDCIRLRIDEPVATGDVTTHSAKEAFEKVLAYCGASLYRDDVDARLVEEAKTGTTTYTGAISKTAGILDVINDPAAATADEQTASYPELVNEARPDGYDSDKDGMPDEWEMLNGLDPNDASDAITYTLDTERGWYTNLEVYLNSVVQHIVQAQNSDAESAVDEYYPECKSTGIDTMESEHSAIARIEYFALNGMKLAQPNKGINVRKIQLANGKVLTDKVIK